MSWIEGIPSDKAEGKLKALYSQMGTGTTRLAEILMPMTYHPDILEAMSKAGPSRLAPGFDRELAESIAVVVSSVNGCSW